MRNRFSHLIFLIFLFSLFSFACSEENRGFSNPKKEERSSFQEDKLSITEEPSTIPGTRFFIIHYEQPVDHRNPSGETFTQTLTLLHRSNSAPLIFYTTGYALPLESFEVEPTRLTQGNQLSIEHRFFGFSVPKSLSWENLNIWQSAQDFHRIVQAFKKYYPARWISTGISKGGMSMIFHRRFFPDDVDGTIAYSTPINREELDPRLAEFINQVGDSSCRQAILDFQRLALQKRDEILPIFIDAANSIGATYRHFNHSRAYEFGVIEFPFAFWQYFDSSYCTKIPNSTASAQEIFDFLNQIIGLSSFLSDAYVRYFQPYYYQVVTEFGDNSYILDPIQDLLEYPGEYSAKSFLPTDLSTTYHPEVMREIANWVRLQGERLMFIYGQNDPWSAAPYVIGSPRLDSHLYIAPNKNHGAKLKDLIPIEKAAAYETLRHWGNIPMLFPLRVEKKSEENFIDRFKFRQNAH